MAILEASEYFGRPLALVVLALMLLSCAGTSMPTATASPSESEQASLQAPTDATDSLEATPTSDPSQLAPTNAPSSPTVDPVWREWLEAPIDNYWLDPDSDRGLGALRFEATEDSTAGSAVSVRTQIVETLAAGGDLIVFMGVMDGLGDRLIFPILLSGRFITSVCLTQSKYSCVGSSTHVPGEDIATFMDAQVGKIARLTLVPNANHWRGTPVFKLYRDHAEASREIGDFLVAIRGVAWTSLSEIPAAINTSVVDTDDVPYLSGLVIYDGPE